MKNRLLGFIIFVILLFINCILVLRNPLYWWDLGCYVWIVTAYEDNGTLNTFKEYNIESVYQKTYAEVKNTLPVEEYNNIISWPSIYREKI